MLNKLRKLQNKKGFTLVELIVVIAIIAILTAVIVPLVSRYTTQATYTSLQAAADSIDSQANAAVNAYAMTGKVFPYVLITAEAPSDGDGTPDNIVAYDKDGKTYTSDGALSGSTKDADLSKVENSISEGLAQKLTKGSKFVVSIKNGGVVGVIYDPTGNLTGGKDLGTVDGYDDAYTYDDNACGVLGIYKVAANDGDSLDANYVVK